MTLQFRHLWVVAALAHVLRMCRTLAWGSHSRIHARGHTMCHAPQLCDTCPDALMLLSHPAHVLHPVSLRQARALAPVHSVSTHARTVSACWCRSRIRRGQAELIKGSLQPVTVLLHIIRLLELTAVKAPTSLERQHADHSDETRWEVHTCTASPDQPHLRYGTLDTLAPGGKRVSTV